MSLARIVHEAVKHDHGSHSTQRPAMLNGSDPGTSAGARDNEQSQSARQSYLADEGPSHSPRESLNAGDLRDNSSLSAQPHESQDFGRRTSYFKSAPNTPKTRTGPPRSLSFGYSFARTSSGYNSHQQQDDFPQNSPLDEDDHSVPYDSADFRGALESFPSRDQSSADKKGKRRETRIVDDAWMMNPKRWFHEPSRDEHSHNTISRTTNGSAVEEVHDLKQGESSNTRSNRDVDKQPDENSTRKPGNPSGELEYQLQTPNYNARNSIRRAFSLPHTHSAAKTGQTKWAKLRAMFPSLVHDHGNPILPGPSAVTSQAVNITDELLTGGLATLMLRLWMDRDEKDHRRVPILLHRLRIRVSDSYHPTEEKRTSFRIECEYANGAARWVIYRQLRDFVSLHTHYAVSNVYNRIGDELPEFPLTSIPYLKFLKKEEANISRASFAHLQREALENYLIKLIRAVMFHPSSNRLASFLEVSALFIALAQSGGAQYKGGYLQIHISGNTGGGFGRKGLGWKEKSIARWCCIRESYLVVLEEPGELTVWDVFLFDSEFKIERPKRYYRQGLNNILHNELSMVKHELGFPDKTPPMSSTAFDDKHLRVQGNNKTHTRRSVIGSIKSGVSKIFHPEHKPRPSQDTRPKDRGSIDDRSDDLSSVSLPSRAHSVMLDPSTHTNPLLPRNGEKIGQDTPNETQKKKKQSDVSKHTFYVVNSQMRLKLFARSERQMLQWITALEKSASSSPYTGRNRFDSFAPIRMNVAAQWLVDGRDYFWNLSRALLLAREVIYIHDWWLSPELLMRRPNKDRYRLDYLLERKAKEGVKIYIILYQEVSNRTTPIDSNYAKQRLMGLHPNIMVQRSPSHFQTGTFYWAHHEKLCVIDQAIAFMGGLDLCFGRWDTPQHVLVDDAEGTDRTEIWPGKDYSNPRVLDFHTLSKPEEDMYDRTRVPRMPWHDVGMQVVGQPARDLSRHFVERWNYLLRIKKHTRLMPFLLPPPEFRPGELTEMGLTGTCEMQICRSAGPWSMGTPTKTEQSIQNAYLKAIQLSEHFVYIENQFFITSTVADDVKIENNIGDAIVQRIIKAHKDHTPWKCCIVIPLLPGFTFPVDHTDASAIRIILECQNRTIARGPNSIFSRLRKEGIDPDEYISVFSLRNWARLRGDVLTTEQVYIHGKVCIVDDRLAIIGSANINERSQRGDRDSELAVVIRDTDMIDGKMAGQSFKVGRFAHTLRIRLMREHLGIDVDAIDEEDLMTNEPVYPENEQQPWDPDKEQRYGEENVTQIRKPHQHTVRGALVETGLDAVKQAAFAAGEATLTGTAKELHGSTYRSIAEDAGDTTLLTERKDFTKEGKEVRGFASAAVPTLEEKIMKDRLAPAQSKESESIPPLPDQPNPKELGMELSANGSVPEEDRNHLKTGQEGSSTHGTIRKHLKNKQSTKWTIPISRPRVDWDDFEDPIADAFWKKVWVASAAYNTEIYRKVFHAIPDDTVTTWKQYKEFILYHERMSKPISETGEPIARVPSETGEESVSGQDTAPPADGKDKSSELSREDGIDTTEYPMRVNSPNENEEKARKPAKGSEPFEKWERDEMESLLKELNGHLVSYPTRFLEGEDLANNFLFNTDRLLPLPIYN